MRYIATLALVAFLAIGCTDDTTAPDSPTLGAVDPVTAWAFTPLYPNDPICSAGVSGIQEGLMPRLHSYFTHNPDWHEIWDWHSGNQLKWHLEYYSRDHTKAGSPRCRNTNSPANWQVQNYMGVLTSQLGDWDGPSKRYLLGNGVNGGYDRLIATVSTIWRCCWTAGAGIQSDTVLTESHGF